MGFPSRSKYSSSIKDHFSQELLQTVELATIKSPDHFKVEISLNQVGYELVVAVVELTVSTVPSAHVQLS